MWTKVIEKAYRESFANSLPYADEAWEALTGENASQNLTPFESDQQIWDEIVAALGAGKGVILGTTFGATVLESNHGYSVSGYININDEGTRTLILYNPHGHEKKIDFKDLSENIKAIYTCDYP